MLKKAFFSKPSATFKCLYTKKRASFEALFRGVYRNRTDYLVTASHTL